MWELLWTVNMLKGLKHSWNLHSSSDSVFVVSEILRLLVNILIPDKKNALLVKVSV